MDRAYSRTVPTRVCRADLVFADGIRYGLLYFVGRHAVLTQSVEFLLERVSNFPFVLR